MSEAKTGHPSEEDILLDPKANSILRNLQQEVQASSAFASGFSTTEEESEEDDGSEAPISDEHVIGDHIEFVPSSIISSEEEQDHTIEDHIEFGPGPADESEEPDHNLEDHIEYVEVSNPTPDPIPEPTLEPTRSPIVIKTRPIFSITLENGSIIKCSDQDLTENEWIHCNLALGKDGDDADGLQGGQGWKDTTQPPTPEPTPSPTTANPTLSPSASPSTSLTPTTSSPTSSSPTTASPTVPPTEAGTDEAPTFHPTERGEPWILQGTVFYDKNANGNRDSNFDTTDYGSDVEYTWGLGGVQIQLMECDPETNEVLGDAELKYDDGENSYATTISTGYDVKMHPKMVNRDEEGGKYSLINIKINRSYYIYATAPDGYLFSGGVCNDDIKGWECSYSSAATFAKGIERRTSTNAHHDGSDTTLQLRGQLSDWNKHGDHARKLNEAKAAPHKKPSEKELELGVREGRSTKCVSVDRSGMPSSNLDLGVMRIGDLFFQDTKVEMKLDLVQPEIEVRDRDLRELSGPNKREQSLMEVVQERVMERLRDLQSMPVVLENGAWVYQLETEEKDAIGVVTSEVLASNLDKSLLMKGAVLDSVSYTDVIYYAPEPEAEEDDDAKNSTTSVKNDAFADSSEEEIDFAAAREDFDSKKEASIKSNQRSQKGGQLAVNLSVRGHFNTDLKVDFDYIVQDSINRDTPIIRRQLSYYNVNCRDQTTKVVDLGFTLDDFLEIHTNRGAKLPPQRLKRQQAGDINNIEEQAFSSACNQKRVLPDYFVESLGGLEIKAKTKGVGGTYILDDGGSSPWAILGGIVAGAVFILCFAFFMYRRGLKKNEQQSSQKVQNVLATHIISCDGDSFADSKSLSKRDMIEKRRSALGSGRPGSLGSGRPGSFRVANEVESPGEMVIVVPDNSERRGIFGVVQREFTNITAALASERQRIGGTDTADLEATLQNNISDQRGSGRGGSLRLPESNLGPISEENEAEDQLRQAKWEAKNDQAMHMHSAENDVAYQMEAGGLDKSQVSRNAVPMIIKFDLSSSDESSSSSEDEDDSSSSSSDESELSFKERASRSGQSKKTTKSKSSRRSSVSNRRKNRKQHNSQDDLNIDRFRSSSTNKSVAKKESFHSSMPDIKSRQQRRRSSKTPTDGIV